MESQSCSVDSQSGSSSNSLVAFSAIERRVRRGAQAIRTYPSTCRKGWRSGTWSGRPDRGAELRLGTRIERRVTDVVSKNALTTCAPSVRRSARHPCSDRAVHSIQLTRTVLVQRIAPCTLFICFDTKGNSHPPHPCPIRVECRSCSGWQPVLRSGNSRRPESSFDLVLR